MKPRRHLGDGLYIEATETGNYLLLKNNTWIIITPTIYEALKKYIEAKEVI